MKKAHMETNMGKFVIGKVVEGMETVEKIGKVQTSRNDRPVTDVKILSCKIE